MSKFVFASVISEIQQSDIYMTVKARICEAPQANLNGARVTEAFIDEIVSNEARYVGLPLYADKKALISGNYNRLGHLYDEKTGEFHSTQIGSFYKFEKEVNGDSCALIGYARIPKRNRKLSKAISELFAEGALKFSFEVAVGEYDELDDETILIDASEHNYLEGTAIVTYPACEEAVALELVAQKADEAEGGESEMTGAKAKTEVAETEVTQPVVAEQETGEQENPETNKENAAVVTREYHDETHVQVAYDTETGKEVRQSVSISTETSQVEEGTLVETTDGIHVAESEIAEDAGEGGEGGDNPADPPAGQTETPSEQTGGETGGQTEVGNDPPSGDPPTDPPAEEEETPEDPPVINVEQKKTAEQMISELSEVVAALKAEIEEMKQTKMTAEKTTVTAEINPFMGDLSATKKYSLLESEAPRTNYSLLEK